MNIVQEELFKDGLEQSPHIKATCRSCVFRERWQCGGSVIQYCCKRSSNRTRNNLLKIKITKPACALFQPKFKQEEKMEEIKIEDVKTMAKTIVYTITRTDSDGESFCYCPFCGVRVDIEFVKMSEIPHGEECGYPVAKRYFDAFGLAGE